MRRESKVSCTNSEEISFWISLRTRPDSLQVELEISHAVPLIYGRNKGNVQCLIRTYTFHAFSHTEAYGIHMGPLLPELHLQMILANNPVVQNMDILCAKDRLSV